MTPRQAACPHPLRERGRVDIFDMVLCHACHGLVPPADPAPAPPDSVTLHASVLWCATCQQATPVVLTDATYYCLHCGTPTGKKEEESP
jgi:hypothetical protein